VSCALRLAAHNNRKGGKNMELDLPAFNEEYVARQRYATAMHEVGHTAAAYAVGFGMKKKGIVLHNDTLEDTLEQYVLKGSAHTRGPGRRSRDPRDEQIKHLLAQIRK
jgi:hypothetical protein